MARSSQLPYFGLNNFRRRGFMMASRKTSASRFSTCSAMDIQWRASASREARVISLVATSE